MSRLLQVFSWMYLLVIVSPGRAQFKAPEAKTPPDDVLKALQARHQQLGKGITFLNKQGLRDPGIADVEVYYTAVANIINHNEFFHADSAAWAMEALDRGLLRARFLSSGELPWAQQSGFPVVRAYRSRIDGSVQPYAVTLPPAYGREPGKKWRLDIVLHGRDTTLTEVKFLKSFDGSKAAPADMDHIRIDIFGRGNNAYRWAGETDVFEAVESFMANERAANRAGLVDPSRVVLRGFSMGGAGTWHLGLHRPDRFCVLGPGAGFTNTHGYVKNLGKLPQYQEACLRIYDAVDYAENAANVPIVAFSGTKDPQMQAAVNIENRLKELGLKMTHLIAPDLEHKFPPDWQKKANALYAKHVADGRPTYPLKVQFVTYTLKYPSSFWVELLGLEKHYQKALVNAERTENGFQVKTSNVRILHLTLPEGEHPVQEVVIDGQEFKAKPWRNQSGGHHLYLKKDDKAWAAVMPQRILTERLRQPRKIAGLTGPIDDAFTSAFLCVRGTEKPWHAPVGVYAEKNLERFHDEWSKYFRGTLPIKDDVDVTNEDIANNHLILFGDPASNSLLAQVLTGLPLQWTKDKITLGGKDYPAADHLPVMIYPSPLNANRYVVLNSGHTFHAPEFQGTNALLFPRLGDYAVLRLRGTEENPLATEVMQAGLFDDFWRLP